MKRGKKALAVLSTAALFGTTPAAVVLPLLSTTVVHAASAAATLTPLKTPVVPDTTPTVNGTQQTTALGTVQIVVPMGGLSAGDSFSFRLPSGVSLSGDPQVTTDGTLAANAIIVPDKVGTDDNGALARDFSVRTIQANKEYQVTFNGNQAGDPASATTMNVVVYVQLGSVLLNGAQEGPLNVSFSAPSNSGFPEGTATVANVNSAGTVSLATVSTSTSDNNFTFDLRLKENVEGALKQGNNTIKLKLPSGYKWDGWASGKSAFNVYGDNIQNGITIHVDGDELDINYDGTGRDKNQAALIDLPLAFHVDDDTLVKPGDINAIVTGLTSVDQGQITVGTYGTYGATVSVANVASLLPGKKEQQLGDIVITEQLKASLVSGRTVTLTLPDGVVWQPYYDYETTSGATLNAPGSLEGSKGLQASGNVSYTGTDGRTLKLTISHESTDSGATLKLKNAQIAIRPDFSGDINIEVGGSAGVTGTVKVATVQPSVKVNASTIKDVKIGEPNQPIGDFTVSEVVAGTFSHKAGQNTVELQLPPGVYFVNTPNVSVTSGDLRITNVRLSPRTDVSETGQSLLFDIDSESTEPSTVTVSGAQVTVNRTVPAGDLTLEVKGSAVGETAVFSDNWASHSTVASGVIAHNVTPAPNQTGITATFTVGGTTYTVNGQQQTMDVAPYLKNDGRVMLPVRFVANALGVNDNNIIWNGADKSVTIFKNNTVVKMTVGSSTMIVNGVAVPMDVAPELYNDGRVMLPIRWIGQALGAQLTWDQATQTVTVTAQ